MYDHRIAWRSSALVLHGPGSVAVALAAIGLMLGASLNVWAQPKAPTAPGAPLTPALAPGQVPEQAQAEPMVADPNAVPGVVPSATSDLRLLTPTSGIAQETVPSSPGADALQASIFGTWIGGWGPFVGGSVGIYRAIRLDIGATHTIKRKLRCTSKTNCEQVNDGWGDITWAVGYSAAIVSYNGIEVSGGLLFIAGDFSPLARLTVPLYAAWLPFRVQDARVFVNYPVGIGVEWGMP